MKEIYAGMLHGDFLDCKQTISVYERKTFWNIVEIIMSNGNKLSSEVFGNIMDVNNTN